MLPPSINVGPGLASLEPFVVTAVAIQVGLRLSDVVLGRRVLLPFGFSPALWMWPQISLLASARRDLNTSLAREWQAGFAGELTAVAEVSSDADILYRGVSTDFAFYLEGTRIPGILIRAAPARLAEGEQAKYQVALATEPKFPVRMLISLSWAEGTPPWHPNPRWNPALEFRAGESMVWQEVVLGLTYNQSVLGDCYFTMEHSVSSDDVLYDSSSAIGARPQSFSVAAEELHSVGVCLSRCTKASRYDFVFSGRSGMRSLRQSPVETPYEVDRGQVLLQPPLPGVPPSGALSCSAAVTLHGNARR